MKKLLIVLFALSACTHPSIGSDGYSSSVSAKRQKQKLLVLQRNLQSAEKEQIKVAKEVEYLKEEMQLIELAIIRATVDGCEDRLARFQDIPLNLFLAERETLHQLIQSGPSPASFEAQIVLDQILRIITNLSE